MIVPIQLAILGDRIELAEAVLELRCWLRRSRTLNLQRLDNGRDDLGELGLVELCHDGDPFGSEPARSRPFTRVQGLLRAVRPVLLTEPTVLWPNRWRLRGSGRNPRPPAYGLMEPVEISSSLQTPVIPSAKFLKKIRSK